MDNPEKIMLFLLPLITLGLFIVALLILWTVTVMLPALLPH